MIVERQDETEAFLKDRLQPATVIGTHISTVVLGEATVFKLKRAVRLPYLDFSTPALRLAACQHELALNRRTAPALYRAVRRVTRASGGGLDLDGEGMLVDCVVEMARFPDDALLATRVDRGVTDAAEIEALARVLAAFQAPLSPVPGSGSQRMAAVLAVNVAGFAASGVLAAADAAALGAAFDATFARLVPVLDARAVAGFVRLGHGDLTLRNIAVIDGIPTPFDALEFDDALATTDVAYDVAFPIMDLWHHGRADLASVLANRWIDITGDAGAVALLPFCMAVRAAVRAHVAGTLAADGGPKAAAVRAEALAYVATARACLAPSAPRLVAIGGLSGSGKSTAAAGLAPSLGTPPGARVLSSDRIRKQMFGVAPTDRLPATAYEPAVSERVYGAMRDAAAAVLAEGRSAVVDAVFDRPQDREAIAAVAWHAGVPFAGFWLSAPAATLHDRIRLRRGDPSDATGAVLEGQLARADGAPDWTPVDTQGGPDAAIATLLAAIPAAVTAVR
ncbi:MAG: AAA family ATPase [Alsobacter sp.]